MTAADSMTSTPTTTSTPATTAVRVGATATLLGSLAFISTVAAGGDLSARESFLLPVGIVGSAIATAGLAVLLWSLPPLLVRLPRWVSATVVAALGFTLALTWFDATAIVGIASTTTDPVFDAIGSSAGVSALFVPKSLLGVVAFGSLAFHGLRAGVLGRAGAALIGLGAVVYLLPPYPPGLVLVSIGLLVATRHTVHTVHAGMAEPRRS